MLALAPLWTAFLVSALSAYPIYRLLLRLKSRQTVSQHAPEGHQVKQGTPTMGGIIIVLGALAGMVVSALLPPPQADSVTATWNFTVSPTLVGTPFPALLILLLGFALIGFVDDFVVPRAFPGKRGLGWKQKILMQIVLAVVAVGVLLGWQITGRAATTVFLILFFANAYNFLDGLDALAGSVLVALCAALLALATLATPEPILSVSAQVFIGATLPFLFMNAPPAKIFMGDVGSLPIGAVLGVVFSNLLFSGGWTFYTPYSSLYAASGDFSTAMVLPVLLLSFVLIAELVPVPLQIFWVKVFKRKLFIYTPIHHAFEKKGWPETRVVWHFFLAQVVFGALALSVVLWTLADSAEAGPTRNQDYPKAEPRPR